MLISVATISLNHLFAIKNKWFNEIQNQREKKKNNWNEKRSEFYFKIVAWT